MPKPRRAGHEQRPQTLSGNSKMKKISIALLGLLIASTAFGQWVNPSSFIPKIAFRAYKDSLGNPWTSYLRSDVADTVANDYSLWFGHYGTRVDSSGTFYFPLPILNSFGQGWGFGVSTYNDIIQDSNTVFDVLLRQGSAFAVDRGAEGTSGLKIYAYSINDDSVYAIHRLPTSIFRNSSNQYNRKTKTHKYPLAVYSVGGDSIYFAICDTNRASPIQAFSATGAISSYFGPACSTGTITAGSVRINKLDDDASPDSTVSVVGGELQMAAWPTNFEIALFTRTCTRDTLAVFTGADSLTAAYTVDAFATRGAITLKPYIAGVVGGYLVVDRPAADTNKYDRYYVVKVK
jgi:hypothetical protein